MFEFLPKFPFWRHFLLQNFGRDLMKKEVFKGFLLYVGPLP
jgi:hypothetical protein